MTEKTMEELVKALDSARESYLSAQNRTSIARSEETDCLNRLNAAQKAVSARMETLMKNAPSGSDWAQSRAERHPVTR